MHRTHKGTPPFVPKSQEVCACYNEFQIHSGGYRDLNGQGTRTLVISRVRSRVVSELSSG